jgi:hypothetical protein
MVMRRVLQLTILVIFFICAVDVASFARAKNPSVTRYKNAVVKSTPKILKKPIYNYTHTKPAQGARATTLHVVKKYHVITGIALKSKYHKKIKLPVLVSRPKPSGPRMVPGQ